MIAFFQEQKRRIVGFLNDYSARTGSFARDAVARLCEYAARGKMIRGALAVVGHELFEDAPAEAIVPVAAALEILQSALLIHDDIMDRDDTRRGDVTLHRGYARQAAEKSLADPEHVGNALAICAGDIAFFITFGLIAEARLEPERIRRIVSLLGSELQLVGAAQMRDVTLGAASPATCAVTEEEIIDLYRYKTARYSFSLPLSAGALAAGRSAGEIAALDRVGETLGVIFQIRDDDLGLFGEEAAVGKPVGSDIREGKKTIMSGRLLGKLAGGEKERFLRVFGNRHLNAADLEYARGLFIHYGVREEMERMVRRYAEGCRRDIALLPGARPEKAGQLLTLLEYSVSRTL